MTYELMMYSSHLSQTILGELHCSVGCQTIECVFSSVLMYIPTLKHLLHWVFIKIMESGSSKETMGGSKFLHNQSRELVVLCLDL